MLGNLIDFLDHGFVQSRSYSTRSESCARDTAHDAADRCVDKDLSAAPVILEVMGKTVCFFTEDGGEFLLLFDRLFVEE